MRTVTFGVANSLDNFIARHDNSVDWLLWGKEAAEVTRDYWKTIDTVVMGRKTYDIARQKGAKGDSGIKTYVFSRTLPRSPNEGVEIIAEDAAVFVRKLKRQMGKDICVMGGGEIVTALLQAHLIDEVALNIHPVLLGAGIPLFRPMTSEIELERQECTPFANGCVFLRYRVRPSRKR
jgi:dihydrofolate reductase